MVCSTIRDALTRLADDGYAIVRTESAPEEITSKREDLERMLQLPSVAKRSTNGHCYGARNFLDALPAGLKFYRLPRILELLTRTLGPDFGLVRGLYFDKSPDANWALQWHQDKTIAVRDNSITCPGFSKPTVKHGVPHFEAPAALLQNMLTLRLHLDAVTEHNGPLIVKPASHLREPTKNSAQVSILLNAGDVLFIRPLVFHTSHAVDSASTNARRRVLHLEFAGQQHLPGRLEWFEYIRDHTTP